MKISIEVDCSPEEARRAMGLPDLSPLHDRYVALLQQSLEQKAVGPEMLEALMRSWAPMGETGANFWRSMFEAGSKPDGG
jgi:oligoendopeptidase F